MIHNGDLMLYGSKTLVVFYQIFASPYSYTRLGKVNHPEKLAEILGNGDVEIRFNQK
ncbi:cyclophilin-like fold protein [Acinetobacter kyonggiensis]|uniref:cyclophilin-like fold protein n=1 Tax=Acinetobacter kyonggiensis TaxID=595670 RepID=UPI003CC7A597